MCVRRMKNIFFIFLLFIIVSCKGKIEENTQKVFAVKDAIESVNGLLIDELVDSVWYVKLQTKDECVLSMNNSDVEFSDNSIYYLSENGIYQFTLQGDFLAKIDNHGHGPKDLGFINDIEWNSLRKELYAWDGMHRRLMVFDCNLNHKRNIPFSGGFTMLADSIFLYVGCYRDDFRKRGVEYCVEKINVLTGDIVDKIKSRILPIETSILPMFSMGTDLYKYNNEIRYLEHRSDSIYSYLENGSSIFLYHLDIGGIYPAELDYPSDEKQSREKAGYVEVKLQFETENFLYITASYLQDRRIWLLCSKKTGEVSKLFSNKCNENDGDFPITWLEPVNDRICYCGRFWPFELSDGKFNKQHLDEEEKGFIQMMNNINEDDNPILMFVKLKSEYV